MSFLYETDVVQVVGLIVCTKAPQCIVALMVSLRVLFLTNISSVSIYLNTSCHPEISRITNHSLKNVFCQPENRPPERFHFRVPPFQKVNGYSSNIVLVLGECVYITFFLVPFSFQSYLCACTFGASAQSQHGVANFVH